MAKLDEYRDSLAEMRLGQLVEELVDLKTTPDPETAADKITLVQKTKEVVLQLNKREVYDDDEPVEPRKRRVKSLKSIL
jgi:hypothetical protein